MILDMFFFSLFNQRQHVLGGVVLGGVVLGGVVLGGVVRWQMSAKRIILHVSWSTLNLISLCTQSPNCIGLISWMGKVSGQWSDYKWHIKESLR